MTAQLPYSNRELDAKFDRVHEKLDDMVGLMKTAAGESSILLQWKNYIVGGISATILLGGSISWWMFTTLESVQASVIQLNSSGRIIGGISSSAIDPKK